MKRKLSNLIKEIESKGERVEIDKLEFLVKFTDSILKNPKIIGKIIGAWEILLKKERRLSNPTEIRMIALYDIMGFCFLGDVKAYENKVPVHYNMFEIISQYLEGNKYGPLTKTLSDFLGCEGKMMKVAILKRYLFN